jgi:ubiquinone biosynthesis protein
MGIYMEELPRDIKTAIRKINTGEVKVELRHQGIDPLVHTLNRVTKHIVTGIIIAGFFVGSAQMVIHNVKPLWGETSAFGIFGFTVAAILAYGMINDLRKGDRDEWSGWKKD